LVHWWYNARNAQALSSCSLPYCKHFFRTEIYISSFNLPTFLPSCLADALLKELLDPLMRLKPFTSELAVSLKVVGYYGRGLAALLRQASQRAARKEPVSLVPHTVASMFEVAVAQAAQDPRAELLARFALGAASVEGDRSGREGGGTKRGDAAGQRADAESWPTVVQMCYSALLRRFGTGMQAATRALTLQVFR
jgi:hypothetical protein